MKNIKNIFAAIALSAIFSNQISAQGFRPETFPEGSY